MPALKLRVELEKLRLSAPFRISVPGVLTPDPVTFREIGPQLWRRVGGSLDRSYRRTDSLQLELLTLSYNHIGVHSGSVARSGWNARLGHPSSWGDSHAIAHRDDESGQSH
jgi:hypothetical protein